MRKGSRDTSDASRARSQELRNESSLSERVLWHHLRNDKLGFRFRRQVRVGPYFLDFYCAKAALCVEVDGEQHAERAGKDATRDAFLRSGGIRTLRIPSLDLFHENGIETNRWLRRIAEICETRSLSPQPPLQDGPLGEGESEKPTALDLHDATYRRARERGQSGWSAEYRDAFARLDAWIGAGSGDLLELGCGAGDLGLHLADLGWRATGVDFSPAAVAWAAAKAAGRARFLRADVRTLPFAEASFDRVLDGHCGHCLVGPDRASFLAEARRVLRPGGVFTGLTMLGPPTGLGAQGYDPATRTTVMDGVAVRYWTSLAEATRDLERAGLRPMRHEIVPGGETGPDMLWIDAA